jgi:hypothetical protein
MKSRCVAEVHFLVNLRYLKEFESRRGASGGRLDLTLLGSGDTLVVRVKYEQTLLMCSVGACLVS